MNGLSIARGWKKWRVAGDEWREGAVERQRRNSDQQYSGGELLVLFVARGRLRFVRKLLRRREGEEKSDAKGKSQGQGVEERDGVSGEGIWGAG
jgi:hypothetical protein